MPANQFQFRISGPDVNTVFILPVGTSMIGRAPDCDLVLSDALVSSRHAQVTYQEPGCAIRDLKSTNSTFLNDEKIVSGVDIPLNEGDKLTIGRYTLWVERAEVAESLPPSPRDDQQQPPPLPPSIRPHQRPYAGGVPPGLALHSLRLLHYLPEIYHPAKPRATNGATSEHSAALDNFFSRFLALFESILLPIDWTVDSFDFYLDLQTAPDEFLPWLASWFALVFDATWSDDQRRTLLQEAHQIFARRGTVWALSRVLEIYTGHKPEIIDTAADLESYTFRIRLPVRKQNVKQDLIEAIVNLNKPAYTNYELIVG